MLYGKMGKLYGQSPASYFNLEDYEVWMKSAIDFACSVGYWEDENYHYEKSKETASNEAGAISSVIERHKQKLSDR